MAFGVIGAIADAIMYGPEGAEYSAMSLVGISPIGGVLPGLEEHTFQYWPETISASRKV